MGTTVVNGVEVGPDGKTEWAKIAAGDEHMSAETTKAKGYDGSSPIGGRVYHGHALREAFIAGAEWQEKRMRDLIDQMRGFGAPWHQIEQLFSKPLTAEDVKAMALPKPIKLLETHQQVLQALFEAEMNEAYFSVSSIAINLDSTKNDVRLICRSLKRKGLAKQVAWHDDDGYICGSGYGITPKGVEYARARGWKGGE